MDEITLLLKRIERLEGEVFEDYTSIIPDDVRFLSEITGVGRSEAIRSLRLCCGDLKEALEVCLYPKTITEEIKKAMRKHEDDKLFCHYKED